MDKPMDKDKQIDEINRELWAAVTKKDGHLLLASLLSQGADLNLADSGHRSPLVIATMFSRISAVEYLVMAGADINKVPNFGNSPLRQAVYFGNYEIAKLLLQHKADVNEQNKDRQTLLHSTLRRSDPQMSLSVSVLEVLLEANPRLDIRDIGGKTPLDMVQTLPSSEKEVRLLFRNKLAEKKAKEKQLGEHEEAAYQKLRNENLESVFESESDIEPEAELESEPEFDIEPEVSTQFCKQISQAASNHCILKAADSWDQLSEKQWQTFCDSVASTKTITTLEISRYNFPRVLKQWEIFCVALENNTSLSPKPKSKPEEKDTKKDDPKKKDPKKKDPKPNLPKRKPWR